MVELAEFLNLLESEGFNVRSHSEGRINRCSTETSKSGNSKPAWFVYKQLGDKFVGIYGDFRDSTTKYFPEYVAKEDRRELMESLSPSEEVSFTNIKFRSFYNVSKKLESHEYLAKKQISVEDVSKIVKVKDGKLLIPMYDITTKNMLGVQEIDAEGGKKFKSGSKHKGSYFFFEGDKSEIIICEGFADAYSIWKSTGKTVFAALSSGNISAVHGELRKIAPSKPVTIAYDNDKAGAEVKKKISDDLTKFICPKEDGFDFNDVYCQGGEGEVISYFNPKYTDLVQFGVKAYPENWLFDQYIERASVNFIIGPPGVGKSFISLHLAMCAANGHSFYGQKPQDDGHVLYVCGEGFRGVNNRIIGSKNHYGFSDEKMILTTRGVMFLDPESLNELIENINTMKLNKINLSMIFIDTLNTNFGNGDENSTSDTPGFINEYI